MAVDEILINVEPMSSTLEEEADRTAEVSPGGTVAGIENVELNTVAMAYSTDMGAFSKFEC